MHDYPTFDFKATTMPYRETIVRVDVGLASDHVEQAAADEALGDRLVAFVRDWAANRAERQLRNLFDLVRQEGRVPDGRHDAPTGNPQKWADDDEDIDQTEHQ